jgi:hypothetical protein
MRAPSAGVSEEVVLRKGAGAAEAPTTNDMASATKRNARQGMRRFIETVRLAGLRPPRPGRRRVPAAGR